MMAPTMPDTTIPSGEARAKAKARRFALIIGGIGLIAFVPGFFIGYTGGIQAALSGEPWPAPIVIACAIIYMALIIGGNALLRRDVDEMAMHNRLRAAMFAGTVYLLVYPVWWLLWMGALVPEPSHWMLFILFYLSFVAGCIYQAFKTAR